MTWPPVDRNNASKFYVDKSEHPSSFFPPYCEGPFYFMSAQLAINVSRNCWKFRFNKFEDVFFGSCIRSFNQNTRFLNVSRNLMPYGVQIKYSDTEIPSVNKHTVAIHSMTSRELIKVHQYFKGAQPIKLEESARYYLTQLKNRAFGERIRTI